MPKRQMRILHLDIETAPNLVFAWGLWNQNIAPVQIVEPAHMLCWTAKWHGERKMFFGSIQHNSPKKMLKELHSLLDEADVVVTYNGKKFDIPRINQELKKEGYAPPSPYAQVDLFRVVKAAFNLPSNKMDYVCQYFGLGEKVKHAGIELWIGCMNGVSSAWKTMRRYNYGDVRLTEKLYAHILPWITTHPNHGLFELNNGCVNCGSTSVQKRGLSRTRCMVYQRYRCSDCGKWMRGKTHVTPKNVGHMRG